MTICFVEFDLMANRLLKSKYDRKVHQSILREAGFRPAEATAQLRQYERTRNSEEKLEMLRDVSKEVQSHGSQMYEDHSWEEILVQHVYRVANPSRTFNYIFGHVDNEDELYPILKRYLKKEDYDVYETYSQRAGGRWPDLFAVKSGRFRGLSTSSIDAKVHYSEFKRLHEQCATFARYSKYVFVATTVGMVAEVGVEQEDSVAHGEDSFRRLLEPAGVGAFVVDMTSGEVSRVFDASKSGEFDEAEQDRRLRILGHKS